jgi:glucokinase
MHGADATSAGPEGFAAGIDAGGTNIKSVALDGEGRVLASSSVPTPGDREALVAAVAEALAGLESDVGDRASSCGLSAPGLASRDGRTIAWMQGRMEAVQGLDWTSALQRSRPVWVLNDAHAATLAEARFGAARGCRNVVLLTLGTGVGGGVIVDGRLLEGHLGRAGHLGHLCLDIDGAPDICRTPGSLEEAVADCTIESRSEGRFATTRDLVAAVEAGDGAAEVLWRRVIRSLACGIASLVNLVDPEIVVLGGGIAGAGPTLFGPLHEEMEEVEWRPLGNSVPIVPAGLGDVAGAIGAACYAAAEDRNGATSGSDECVG